MEFESGYVCGMLAAKGRINTKNDFYISLETADSELLEIAKRFLSLFGHINVGQKERKGFKSFIITLRGDGGRAIASYGINTGRREWNVPQQAFVSEKFRVGFLRGFFDFSGTIKARLRKKGQKERVMKTSSINKDGLNQVKALLKIEGIGAMVYRAGKNYVLEINGKNNLETFLKKIGFEKNSKRELIKKLLNPVEFEKVLASR